LVETGAAGLWTLLGENVLIGDSVVVLTIGGTGIT